MRMHAEPARDAPVGQQVAGASRHSQLRHSQLRSAQPRRPLLAGTLKDDALDLAGALARALPAAAATDHRNPSLASGSAGLAVCVGHLARTRSDQPAETALTHLE